MNSGSGWTGRLRLPDAKTVKAALPTLLLWCLLYLLLAAAIRNGDAIESRFTAFSLRFGEDLSGEKAQAARQYAIDQKEENPFWYTYWRQDQARVKGETAELDTVCIRYSGEGRLAWDTTFLQGSWPGAADEDGCALSRPLAGSLFGSMDIVGMTVQVDGEEAIVRGVFEGEEPLVLLSEGEGTGTGSWQAAELSGGPKGADRTDAEAFAVSSSLGAPSAILTGKTILFIGWFLAFLPVIILVVRGLCQIFILVPARRRGLAALILFLALAAALPLLLGLLPDWLIPGQWSDFSWWTILGEDLDTALRAFLGITPALRDVEGRLLFLGQAALCLLSSLLALALCFRHGRTINNREA